MGGEGIGESDAVDLLTRAVAKISASLREPDLADGDADRSISARPSTRST
jgi:hypothetical protein